METTLRVVVLHPNSDYVRLAETRDGADPNAIERFAPVADSVAVRSGASGPSRIRVRFRELSTAQQAALLRLGPLADREEYAELATLVEDESIRSLADLEQAGSDALMLRARNLGVDRWGVWPGPDGESLTAELADARGPRCLVVDLGSLATREEQAITAGALLERLWHRRTAREPIAIVIDEAHNVCPAEPADPITALATEQSIRIAGEGRKFGLYLIVVMQRPQKVQENVLTEAALTRVDRMAADAWSSIRKPRSTASPRASTFERPPRRWWTRWRTTGASGCEPQRGRDPLLYPYVARRRPYVRASKARAPHLGPRARLAPAHSAPGCIRNRRVIVFSEWDADGTVPLYLELVVRLTRARPSTGRAYTSTRMGASCSFASGGVRRSQRRRWRR